jgi:hypothetical protein
MRWRRRRAVAPNADEPAWRLVESPIFQAGLVSLRGLGDRIVAEVLFGLQQRTRRGSKTRPAALARVCDAARRAAVPSLTALAESGCAEDRHLLRALVRHARLAASDPAAEAGKDCWELAVFGHHGRLSFTAISQPWLRAAARAWAVDDLPRRRGSRAGAAVQARVNALVLLSASLRHSRSDEGAVPARLGRADVETFLNRLAFLADRGEITTSTRMRTCRHVRVLLAGFRSAGLTRPSGPAGGLPDDFSLARRDIPAAAADPEPGRDLPGAALAQLVGRLDRL